MQIVFILSMAVIATGMYACISSRNIIKIIIGLGIANYGVNLFLVQLGYKAGAIAPIFTHAQSLPMVLPTPQALTLTNIVISFATTALMLSVSLFIHKKTGSLDIKEVGGLKE